MDAEDFATKNHQTNCQKNFMEIHYNEHEMLEFMNNEIRLLGVENDLEVRYIDNKKGKGLFAKRDFKKRELVLVEFPFCVARIPSELNGITRNSACDHCLKYIGPLENQLLDLVEKCATALNINVKDFQWELPFKDDCLPTKIVEPIPCPYCNHVFYCSEKCRQSAWDQYHEVMCPGSAVGPDDPYILFEKHAFKYCDNFFLLEKMLAIIIQQTRKLNGDTNAAWSPWRFFLKTSWIDLMCEQMARPNDNLSELRQEIIRRLVLCLDLLKKMFYKPEKDDPRVLQHFFTLEFLDNLMGLGNINCACMNVWSPFNDYLRCVMEKHTESEPLFLERVVPMVLLAQHYKRIPPFANGIGICVVHSCLNHDCNPNTYSVGGFGLGKSEKQIMEEGEEARISIVALRDIKKGEEITINYLDFENVPVTERRKLLKQKYLFECTDRKSVV